MANKAIYLGKSIYIGAFLMLGCSSSGVMGCGSSGQGAPTVDSQLLGIYLIDKYQGSGDGCGQLMDLDGAPRLALYSTPSAENPDEARLVGQFCGSVDNCRDRIRDFPAVINYAFFEGTDAAGWQGWGIASQGSLGDQCLVDVQSHSLTSPSAQTISIDTRTVETVFAPAVPEGSNEGTCSIRDAIASVSDDSPCKGLFLLEATFETSL
jgi:hypothetical protein